MAISDRRVLEVTLLQDENGNILGYKPQFMNALKLVANAIVQEAYINVNEEETMNEIMEDVKRQFKWSKPLLSGMVNGYLKSYFKRCRSQYYKFCIKHRDSKKLDDCIPSSWLQLIEYWKLLEGSKKCY